MNADQIILEPVLTEKANALREGDQKKYVFKVHKRANKIQVMEAVKELFSVTPVSCNVANVRGVKRANSYISKNSFRRGHGVTASWKKATVELTKGEQITIFEGA